VFWSEYIPYTALKDIPVTVSMACNTSFPIAGR